MWITVRLVFMDGSPFDVVPLAGYFACKLNSDASTFPDIPRQHISRLTVPPISQR